MATISNADFRKIKKLALNDPAILSELRASGLDRPTLKATVQAIEDWSNEAAVRTDAKADIDAAAGITTTNTFATQLFKLWAQYHGGS